MLQLSPSCLATVQVCDWVSGAPKEPTSVRRAGQGGSRPGSRPAAASASRIRSRPPPPSCCPPAAPLLPPPRERNRYGLRGSRFGRLPGTAPVLRLPLLSPAQVGSPTSESVSERLDPLQTGLPPQPSPKPAFQRNPRMRTGGTSVPRI